MTHARKHTPGPWFRDGFNLSSVIHCTAERGSPEAKHLCGDYDVIARCEGENWEANSRLIHTAPDLLDALVTALPYVECAVGDPSYKPGAVAAVLKQIRDVMAKAEDGL